MARSKFESNEELVNFFIDNASDEDTLRNEIEAFDLNNPNITYEKKFRELEKKYGGRRGNTIRIEIRELAYDYSVISKFPEEYMLDDRMQKKDVKINFTPIEENYFLEDPHIVLENLQKHIDFMSALYSNYYKVLISRTNEESTTPIYIVGRISISEELGIETISIENRGKVRLDLENITEYALFPGQIIMVKGTSDTFTFIVSDVITELFIPPPPLNNSQFLIGVVSGPFSTVELDYSIFLSFLDKICTEVNVLIIIGPFVDNDNPIIQEGIVNSEVLKIKNGSYEDIFNKIQGNIIDLHKTTGCEIIYVPHIREIEHIFPLPMPGLDNTYQTNYVTSPQEPKKNILKKFHCPPSPAQISINDTRIHVAPYDFIHEIIQSAALRTQKLINKISMSLLQTMNQHSYLPVIPNSLPVEYSKYNYFKFEQPPHILIVQSKFPVQAESVPGMICVKSTSFVEGNKIGNYAIINVAGQGGRMINECVGVKYYRINS